MGIQRHEIFFYCRPGFEPDLGREVRDWAQARGIGGRVEAPGGAGYVRFAAAEEKDAAALAGALRRFTLVFARQWFRVLFELQPGKGDDVVEGVMEGLEEAARRFRAAPRVREVLAEAPDSDAGRLLWPRLEGLGEAVAAGAAERRWLRPEGRGSPRLHVCLLPGGRVPVGVSDPRGSAPWPMGIPRLRLPPGAPSRAARKVEEALVVLLDEPERAKMLKPGRRVVDLGAAPGGWSWQFARRGLLVTAVDNGRLAPEVLETGLVDHVRMDGFTYRPERPVDWMVCDMVKAAERVARLVGLWGARGLARCCLFNWKLPNRDRLREVRRCRAVVERELGRAGVPYTLRLRHLYHDREEVTGFLSIRGPGGAPAARRTRRPGTRKRARGRPRRA